MPSFFSFWTPPPHPIPHGVERSPAAGAVALPASGVAVLRYEPRSGVAEKEGQHHVAAGAGGGRAGGAVADGGTSEKLAAKDAEMAAKDAEIAALMSQIAALMSQLKAQLSGPPAGSAGARGGAGGAGAGGAGAGLGPPTASKQGSPFQNTVSPPGT